MVAQNVVSPDKQYEEVVEAHLRLRRKIDDGNLAKVKDHRGVVPPSLRTKAQNAAIKASQQKVDALAEKLIASQDLTLQETKEILGKVIDKLTSERQHEQQLQLHKGMEAT